MARSDGRYLVFLCFATTIALLVFWFVRHALLIIYVSAVFAVVLKPLVDWLHRKSILGWRPGRAAGLIILIVCLSAFLGGMLAIAVPSIVSNASNFASSMAGQSGALQKRFHSVPLLGSLDLSGLLSRISGGIAKILPAIGGASADIVTGLLLTAYFILDGAPLLKLSMHAFPPQMRVRLEATLCRAARRMRHWLGGQAMLMAILGGASALTFGLMGLPYFYLLALFAGVSNIVPLLGPLATVVLAGAVAATQSGWDVLGVIIFYLVYQQVENAVLTPKIMNAQVQLSAPVVIVALLIGGEVAGIAGALVAVPSAALVAELANEYLLYDGPLDELTSG